MVSDIVSVAASTAAAGRCAATSVVFFEDFKTADLALLRQEQLAEEISCNHQRLLFLWRAPRALVVGRSDTRLPHFADAVDRLLAEGWPVLIRRSGGSACPVSEGTLQIALARAVFTATTIDSAYIELANMIRTVLESYGLKVQSGAGPAASAQDAMTFPQRPKSRWPFAALAPMQRPTHGDHGGNNDRQGRSRGIRPHRQSLLPSCRLCGALFGLCGWRAATGPASRSHF